MLTPREVAEKLKVLVHTIYDWCRAGKLPYDQIGNQIRISEDCLQQFLADRERKAT